MTRDEALEKFRTGEAAEIFQRINLKCRNALLGKRDQFAQALRSAFWSIMEKAKETPDFQVREVQLSYLQVHVLDGSYQWQAELHDKQGDYVETDISEIFEMKDFFETYEACRDELYQSAAQYVSALTPADCDVMMVENFRNLVPYFYLLGVYAFRGLDEDPRFQEIKIYKVFRVLIGGRRDASFMVFYKLENREEGKPTLDKLQKEPKEEDYSSDEFSLFDFSEMLFKDDNLSLRNFPFSNFRRVSFEEVEMYGSKCLLTDWKGATIKNCLFDGSCFNGADFTDATIENVSFLGARLDVSKDQKENPVNPSVIPASFQNAKLKNVDFRCSFLAGCDFRGAEFGRTNFAEADMKDALISKEYRDVLDLTEEQKKSICWVSA